MQLWKSPSFPEYDPLREQLSKDLYSSTPPSPPFYMVFGEGKAAPAFKHPTFSAALTEANRLASAHPGIKFFILKPTQYQKVEKPAPVTQYV